MVQPDGQGPEAGEPRGVLCASEGEERQTAGVDHVTVEQFEARMEENLDIGSGRCGREVPPVAGEACLDSQAGQREETAVGNPDGSGPRCQGMVQQVLEPIFERDFAEHSYGFRPDAAARTPSAGGQSLLEAGQQLGGGRGPARATSTRFRTSD